MQFSIHLLIFHFPNNEAVHVYVSIQIIRHTLYLVMATSDATSCDSISNIYVFLVGLLVQVLTQCSPHVYTRDQLFPVFEA